jgi:hypothetical protein
MWVLFFCKKAKFIKVLYSVNEPNSNFSDDLDVEQLHLNVQAFEKVAHGENQADQWDNLIFHRVSVG